MKVFKLAGLILLLSVFFIPQVACAIGLEVAVGIWNQDPEGGLAYKGESLSVADDLKYSDKSRIFGRLKIDMPLVIPNIYLMATPVKFDGAGSKGSGFTFGDKTFSANVPFTSEVRLDQYDLGFYYGLPFVETATLDKVNIDVGLNLKVVDLEAEINQTSTSTRESKSATLPIPMVYLSVQLRPLKVLSLEGELRGVAYNSNHYYDLIGRAKYRFFRAAFVGIGYRYQDLEIDEKDVKAKVRFGGPVVEAGVEF